MILKILIFSYVSSFGFQHLFVPYSPEEDILLKNDVYRVFENRFFNYRYKSVIIPPETKYSFISFSYLKWIAGSKINKVSIYYEKFKAILSFKYFDYGKFEYYEFPSEDPLLTYNPFALSIGITPVLNISKIFPLYISIFYNEEKILDKKTSNFTINADLFVNVYNNIKFEISLFNVGTKPSYYDEYIRIPSYVDAKSFVYVERFDILLNLMYRRGLWGSDNFYNGYFISFEKDIRNFMTLFGGFGKKDDIGNFGVGFKLRFKNFLSFVYSFRPSKEFEDINSFTLKIEF